MLETKSSPMLETKLETSKFQCVVDLRLGSLSSVFSVLLTSIFSLLAWSRSPYSVPVIELKYVRRSTGESREIAFCGMREESLRIADDSPPQNASVFGTKRVKQIH